MKEFIETVPEGVRYLSEWSDFKLKNYPRKCIIDKGITSSGFINYCLSFAKDPIIFVTKNINDLSLLYSGNVLIYNNDKEEIVEDINRELKKDELPIKILVTPENYQVVVDILTNLLIYPKFITVVDEFEKLMRNNEFTEELKKSFTAILSFVSTPRIFDIVKEENFYKDLPYYKIDWSKNPNKLKK